jgi:hypothetical protein
MGNHPTGPVYTILDYYNNITKSSIERFWRAAYEIRNRTYTADKAVSDGLFWLGHYPLGPATPFLSGVWQVPILSLELDFPNAATGTVDVKVDTPAGSNVQTKSTRLTDRENDQSIPASEVKCTLNAPRTKLTVEVKTASATQMVIGGVYHGVVTVGDEMIAAIAALVTSNS